MFPLIISRENVLIYFFSVLGTKQTELGQANMKHTDGAK